MTYRVAIDYDTVVHGASEGTLLRLQEYISDFDLVYVISSPSLETEANEWVKDFGPATLCVLKDVQHQDYVGADVWVHGRLDRAVSSVSIDTMYTKINESLMDSKNIL